MDQNLPNIAPKVEVQSVLPTAVVISDSKYQALADHLCETLRFQNLNVATKPTDNFDYWFNLAENQTYLKKASTSIKLLLEESDSAKIEDSAYKIARLMFGQTDESEAKVEIPRQVTLTLPEPPPTVVAEPIKINAPVIDPAPDPVIVPISQPEIVAKPKLRPWKLVVFGSFMVLLTTILVPTFFLGVNLLLIYQDAQGLKSQLNSSNVKQSVKTIAQIQDKIDVSRSVLSKISPIGNVVGLKSGVTRLDKILASAKIIAEAGSSTINAASKLETLKGITTEQTVNWDQVATAKIDLDQAVRAVNLLSVMPKDPLVDNYTSVISGQGDSLSFASAILPKLKDIFASTSSKKYLVLLQNNAELRPSGGFIGAYAIVSFDHGKLLSYKINDVYDADGQLKGRVTPPDEILHFLGQPSWYLRDSNFSPDFSLTARRAAWFLEKETGEKVDGVIGIDMFFIQDLLKANGPINLVDFNETVTADNFFQKAEYQAEINFFPGSTKKKDYLQAVGQQLIDQLSKSSNPSKLVPAFTSSLAGKHLQFYFNDDQTQNVFKRFGYDGHLDTQTVSQSDNSLAVVEANFGANKANYFIKRSLEITEDISKTGDIDVTVKITLANSSPSEAWPGGIYKNYLRLYVPPQASLKSVNLGDNRQATISAFIDEKLLKRIDSNHVLVLETTDKTSRNWGILNEVAPNSSRTITFVYHLPALNFNLSNLSHSISIRKQAGTDNDPLSLKINYPVFLTPNLTLGDGALANSQQIQYNTTLATDKVFNILWKKQI